MCMCTCCIPGPSTLRRDIIPNSKNTNTRVKKCGHKYKKILKAVQIIHACIHTMHTVQSYTYMKVEGKHRCTTCTFTPSQQRIVVHDLRHLFKGFIDVLLFKTMGFVLMDVSVGLKHFSGVGQHPSKGRHHRLRIGHD